MPMQYYIRGVAIVTVGAVRLVYYGAITTTTIGYRLTITQTDLTEPSSSICKLKQIATTNKGLIYFMKFGRLAFFLPSSSSYRVDGSYRS